MVWGAQASLLASVVSVSILLLLGVPIGLLATFLGPSLTHAMIAIDVSATPIFMRLTRAQVITVKVEDCIEAARAVGNPPWRIVLRHVLPNIAAPLTVQATPAIGAAVIAEASLSFLGLDQQPPAPTWGSMLNTARNCVDSPPWMAIWPGLAIFLLVLWFNLLGDGCATPSTADSAEPGPQAAPKVKRVPVDERSTFSPSTCCAMAMKGSPLQCIGISQSGFTSRRASAVCRR